VKAILHTQYGPPDLLQFKEVDKPAPKDDEVLITIHATTVSSGDCNVRNFTFVTKSMLPIAKLMFGIGKPWKERVLGTELAGEVEGAGKDVKRYKTGEPGCCLDRHGGRRARPVRMPSRNVWSAV
jgi:NADPH:quinone reductase-like Zn-dependent oxidoreductase